MNSLSVLEKKRTKTYRSRKNLNQNSCGKSTIQNFYDCVQYFILSKKIDCPSDTFLELCNSPVNIFMHNIEKCPHHNILKESLAILQHFTSMGVIFSIQFHINNNMKNFICTNDQ